MPTLRLLSMLLVSLVVGAGLLACGESDEDEITAAIEADTTEGDPADCTELQTQAFTEQTTGETGEAAVKACEENAPDGNADSVEVSNIEVDGDAAAADVAVTGSVFDGQTVQVSLAKEDDQWKLDELTGFVDFDLATLSKAFAEEVVAEGGITEKQAACVEEQFNSLGVAEAQAFFTDPATAAFEQIFAPC